MLSGALISFVDRERGVVSLANREDSACRDRMLVAQHGLHASTQTIFGLIFIGEDMSLLCAYYRLEIYQDFLARSCNTVAGHEFV